MDFLQRISIIFERGTGRPRDADKRQPRAHDDLIAMGVAKLQPYLTKARSQGLIADSAQPGAAATAAVY